MVIEYDMLSSTSQRNLVQTVNEWIAMGVGWEPLGGVATVETMVYAPTSRTVVQYTQAMVKGAACN